MCVCVCVGVDENRQAWRKRRGDKAKARTERMRKTKKERVIAIPASGNILALKGNLGEFRTHNIMNI